MAHHPELARAYHTFNGHILFATSLSPRQRELAGPEGGRRASVGVRVEAAPALAADAGITAAEVSWVTEGPGAPGWSPTERALISAVDELLADARVADATWEVLASTLDVEQLLDVIFTVGAYDVLAMALRSFGVPLDDDLQ